MSTQHRSRETQSQPEREQDTDTPDVVALATGSTSYCPDQAHVPGCPKVGGDAQTIPYLTAKQLFLRNRLKRADCLQDDTEASDD